MAMKLKEKFYEYEGQRYKLTKLNADAGSYVAFKIAGVALPLLQGLSGKGLQENDLKLLSQAISSMGRAEFLEVQKILLGTVQKITTAGGVDMPMPILKADGSYADEEMAMDAKAVITLTVQAALFNVGGFFTVDEPSETKS
jgi:hypothetical protein